MLAQILYTFIGLYLLTKFLQLVINHAKKRRQFRNWPQPYAPFLLGNLSLYTKRPLNHHFIPIVEEMAKDYENKDKIFVTWITVFPAIITFNKEHAKQIFSKSDPDIMNKSELFYKGIDECAKNSLLTIDGERWKIRRKILSAPFHTTNFDNLVKITNTETAKLVSYLKRNPCKDIMRESKKISLSLLFNLLYEYDLADELDSVIEMTSVSTDILTRKAFSIYMISPALYRISSLAGEETKCLKELMEFKNKMLNAKIESSRMSLENKSKKIENDARDGKTSNLTLIEILLKNFKNAIESKLDSQWQGFDMDEIRAQLDTFIIAGVDTTSAALTFLFYHLAKYPNYQQQVYEEIRNVIGSDRNRELTLEEIKKLVFLEAFISESLRYQPIIPMIARQTNKDFKLDDKYTVPAGTAICIYLEKMLNDPDNFPEPRKFRPERYLESQKENLYVNVPFSGGSRNCVAKRIALHIMAFVAVDIIRNFEIKFTASTPKELDKSKLTFELIMKPINPIELKFVERQS